MKPQLLIRIQKPEHQKKSQLLANRLELVIQSDSEYKDSPAALFFLQFSDTGLELASNLADLGNPLCVEFTNGANAHRKRFGGGKGQDIAKAVGLQKKSHINVLDATAGLGRDAFVLASLGCHVQMMERNPIVYELLNDGLERAGSDPDLHEILSRLSLLQCDAIASDIDPVEVVYLDPMFPSREKSAKVKKELRYLQNIVGYDAEADQLLSWAESKAINRVVVKRPKLAPYLNGKKPTLSFTGKSGRFDVYVKAAF